MTQRLIWNFEFASPPSAFSFATLAHAKEEQNIKWESRAFWPAEAIITLYALDTSLLDIANYKQKHREDTYYLLPQSNYNIKKRRNELIYKPLLQHTTQILGFGAKINLEQLPTDAPADLQQIVTAINKHHKELFVKKEAFIYKCATVPTIKIELARLQIAEQIYFSVCVEGRSQHLVTTISNNLLGTYEACDYVTFINKILS